jgi:DNA-binding transcriptional regulator of glucitol operon
VLRLALSPRWWVWHVLTLGAMATCAFLAAWQWGRAGSAMGSVLNVGYGLQWPAFAIFFGVMWWRFLRLEARRLAGEDVDEQVSPPVEAEPVQDVHEPAPAAPAVAAVEDAGEGGPFGVRRTAADAVEDDEDPQLAAYNRMLAQLAEHDRGR